MAKRAVKGKAKKVERYSIKKIKKARVNAAKRGIKTITKTKSPASNAANTQYDVLIIGAGPAGLAAAIYSARYNLKSLVLGKEIGGVANEAWEVENYPGVGKTTGIELMKKFAAQAMHMGAKVMDIEIFDIYKKDGAFYAIDTNKDTYKGTSIIIATGTRHRKLELPDEQKFLGKGVSYCATCDGPLFRNKKVAVIGGGDSAATAAYLMTQYSQKVYIIVRSAKLRAEPFNIHRIEKNPKIEIIKNATVTSIIGDNFVREVKLSNGETLDVEGIFVEIGLIPATILLKNLSLSFDAQGYIIVNGEMKTNVGGCFAAGDITTASGKFKQIVTAAAEGGMAARSAYAYVKDKEGAR